MVEGQACECSIASTTVAFCSNRFGSFTMECTREVRIAERRAQRTVDLNRLAFRYNPVDYSSSRHVAIGKMSHDLYLLPGSKVQ